MHLDIYYKEPLTKHFQEFLLNTTKQYIKSHLDKVRLSMFDDTIKQLYIYNEKPDNITLQVILMGASNLELYDSGEYISIQVKKDMFLPQYSNVSLQSLCAMVNYGTVDIRAFPVFSDAFQHIVDNYKAYKLLFN